MSAKGHSSARHGSDAKEQCNDDAGDEGVGVTQRSSNPSSIGASDSKESDTESTGAISTAAATAATTTTATTTAPATVQRSAADCVPEEVWLIVFSFVDWRTWCQASMASTALRDAAASWKLWESEFGALRGRCSSLAQLKQLLAQRSATAENFARNKPQQLALRGHSNYLRSFSLYNDIVLTASEVNVWNV